MAAPMILLLAGAGGLLLLMGSGKKAAPSTATASADAQAEMATEMANALRLLGVDATGNLSGPVTADAIAQATEIASRIDRAGYHEAAEALRKTISLASKTVPSPPPEKQVPLPSIPAYLQEQFNRALQMERDPAKLRIILAGLKALPQTTDVVAAEQQLEALIVQLEAKQTVDETLLTVDKIIKDVPPIPSVPTAATPQPMPVPKTETQMAAEAMALNLLNVQAKYGLPKAKGKEDMSLVKRFQTLAGLTSDGKSGPTSTFECARYGVSNLPLVMYWPKSATATNVYEYRDKLRALASEVRGKGDTARASLLEASAAKERGQAGIVGSMPA